VNDNKYSLTFPENNIYLVEKFSEGTAINTIAGFLKIQSIFDEKICNEIINKLIEANDSLRIKIYEENNTSYQIINDYKYENIKFIDMSGKSHEEIQKFFDDSVKIPFNFLGNKLYEFTIIRYDDNTGYIFMKMHHIISDAWALGQAINQFIKMYSDYQNNINEKYNALSYVDFMESEKEYISSEKYIKDEEFWREYLKDIQPSVSLKAVTSKISTKASRYSIVLDKEINDKIIEYTKVNKVSPYTLFLAALSTYIYRIKDKKDFVIGTPVLNRSNFKEKQMLGMFVSTMPTRMRIEDGIKFIDLIKQIGTDIMTLFRHQKYPITKTLEHIHNTTDINGRIYNIMLSYQNARSNISNSDFFSTNWLFSGNIQDDLEIHIMDIDNSGILNINYDYLTELFDGIEIKYLHTRLMAIIQNAIDDIDVDLENIHIMSKEEENKILYEFNDTNTEYPKDKTVIELFEEQVEKNPDNIALVFEDKQVTYRELNDKANQLAYYLKGSKNFKKRGNISIYMNRSIELIYSLIAINKCGCAYIPIDPAYPSERVQYILNDSNADLVITNIDFSFEVNSEVINVANVNLSEISKLNINLTASRGDLVYIIYTSGSTGNPKGVMINNQNLINFLFGINKELKLSDKDVMVSITTISFDIFGLEIWLTLVNGAKLILANELEQIDSNLLNILCIKNGVNFIQTTPTKLRMLTNNKDIEYIKNMKKILLGGESLPNEYILKLKELTDSEIINVYGPTETTIWSTIKNITNFDYIVAGKPIQNTKAFVLDTKNRILPININGQLVIAGDSVAAGYYNNKKLTDKMFINIEDVDSKVYLTGDLAIVNFQGDIKILGRTDFQVKLNGQRVELEEIEQKILKYKSISSVVVTVKNESNLICFYVLENANKPIDEIELKKYLYLKMPIYMIPTRFEKIDSMPLTPNGKIDRKKILQLDLKQIEDIIIMPKNQVQKLILESWQVILNDKKFGITSNFFELGGDSFDAIKIKIDLLSKGIRIDYADVFKYPTIEGLSENINKTNTNIEFDIAGYKKDFSNILNQNKEINYIPNKKKVGNVLITGVTGFLGAHIVSEFIDKEDGIVYCLIRRKNKLNSNQRLKDTLNFFFGNKYNKFIGTRIIAVDGDIIKENLGINNSLNIASHVDFVVHSAACVKHYGNKQSFIDINIKGTENVVKFCYENNKKMIHISTLSVSGNAFESANIKQNENEKEILFDETCFYNNQSVDNVYVYTKFKSEELVLDYINKGLKANIIRFGNLTGRYTDSKFQPNVEDNAFANRIKSIINIGKIPDSCYDMYIEFTPIDLSAELVVKVMQFFNQEHNMFHAFNHNHIYVEQFISILKSINIHINVITNEEFSKYIGNIINNKQKSKVLVGIINDLNANNLLEYSNNIKIKSDLTIKYLKSIGFEWNNIDDDYVRNYIKYLIDINFLKI
jgi:amino acid adenylation domain-containing protein/thioester reductase-like protein